MDMDVRSLTIADSLEIVKQNPHSLAGVVCGSRVLGKIEGIREAMESSILTIKKTKNQKKRERKPLPLF